MNIPHRELIVTLRYTRNWMIKDIAREMECTQQQVTRVLRRWRTHGTVADLRRQPRRRSTTRNQDVAICRMGQRQPHLRPREVKVALRLRCHTRTIKRRWKERGLERHIARKKWFMTARHAYYRAAWAREMIRTRTSDWDRVIWCDKKTFRLGVYGREWVTRTPGTALNQRNLSINDRYAGKVQVSIGVTSQGIASINTFRENMNSEKYRNILRDHHLPAARRIFGLRLPWYFAHDNDRKHTSQLVRTYLVGARVRFLPWPSKSPDLNPAENVWAQLTRKVHDESPNTVDELEASILRALRSIDANFFRHLVDSMPTRLQAVIDAEGWQTKY